MSKMFNDPGFVYDIGGIQAFRKGRDTHKGIDRVSSQLTRVTQTEEADIEKFCPVHKTSKHSLVTCRKFKFSTLADRKKALKDKSICFRCCSSTKHIARNCKVSVKCSHCGSTRHATPMHIDETGDSLSREVNSHGGEAAEDEVSAKCTSLCGDAFVGRSCSKTLLVNVFPNERPEMAVRVYAIVDDQNNRSLVRSELLDRLGDYSDPTPYTLTSCSGSATVVGRRAMGYSVQSLEGTETMKLPVLIECNDIPNNRSEIATPEVVSHHPHLMQLEGHIPPLDSTADIQLLIGRDLVEAHQVMQQQIIGPENAPFAQRIKLGWVVVGEVCLGRLHKPNISVKKTQVLGDGRGTIFDPCKSSLQLKEFHGYDAFDCHGCPVDSIFQRSSDDNKIGLSLKIESF